MAALVKGFRTPASHWREGVQVVCVKFSKLVMVRVHGLFKSREPHPFVRSENDHPSVPTCLSAERRAQRQSKDAAANAAAPAEPAHSVLARASTVLG